MSSFRIERDRDAYFVIRGYRYQIDSTIMRWLDLDKNEHLELECGEDIDLVSTAMASPETEVARELNQIKRSESPISLNTDSAKTALANAVAHFSANLDASVRFRFCTTADRATERGSQFPNHESGIGVWERIRSGELSAEEESKALKGIMRIAKSFSKPTTLNASVWERFTQFVAAADEPKFRDFVLRFEWSTGQQDFASLQESILVKLVESGLSPHAAHAKELHARLFLHLVDLLSHAGRKAISRTQLSELAKLPSLSTHERGILNLIVSEVLGLESRLTEAEAAIESQWAAILAIQAHLPKDNEIAQVTLTNEIPKLSLGLPPLVRLASPRREITDRLSSEVASRTWTALVGSVGTGKTQLSLLISNRLAVPVVNISLRDLTSEEAVMRILVALSRGSKQDHLPLTDGEIAVTLSGFARHSLLIVDDLPRIEQGSELSVLLGHIARSCHDNDIRLLTTSHFPLAEGFIESLHPAIAENVSVPKFSADEANELLVAYGAPTSLPNSRIAERITLLADGNAALVVAIVRSLKNSNWEVEYLEPGNLSNRPETQVLIDETVRRLLTSVSETNSRELLYRLSLIIGTFDNVQIDSLASVTPTIDHPREQLARIAGLWVEERPDRQFAVSPLIKPLGNSELAPSVKQSSYTNLADILIRRRALNVYEIVEASYYLSLSGNPVRYGLFLIGALQPSRKLPVRELRHLFRMTNVNRAIVAEMDISLRILLCSRQLILADYLGESFDEIVKDMMTAISLGKAKDNWAIYSAAASTARITAKLDVDIALLLCGKALSLHDEVIATIRNTFKGDEVFAQTDFRANFFWFTPLFIRTVDDLDKWMSFLATLSPTDLVTFFAWKMAPVGSMTLLDHVWVSESNKPVSDRDWSRVVKSLQRAARFAEAHKLEVLWCAATRALVVTHAEYLNDLNEAIRIGRESLAHEMSGNESRFLINDAVGRQFIYKKQFADGVSWLEAALKSTSEEYPGVRIQTLLNLSTAIGDRDASRAAELCAQAVAIATSFPKSVSELDTAAAYSELGLAEWLKEKQADLVYGHFSRAATLLIRKIYSKEEKRAWKQRVAAFLHGLGYISTILTTGTPPLAAGDGSRYVPPRRGGFINASESGADYFDKQGYIKSYEALIAQSLAQLASASGMEDEEYRWASLGYQSSERNGDSLLASQLGQMLLPFYVREWRPTEIVEVALRTCKIVMAAAGKYGTSNQAVFAVESAVDIVGELSEQNREAAEQWALETGIVPAAIELLRIRVSDSTLAKTRAAELIHVVREASRLVANEREWSDVAGIMEDIFLGEVESDELSRRANEKTTYFARPRFIIGFLGASLADSVDLRKACCLQIAAFFQLKDIMAPDGSTFTRIAMPFLRAFWTKQLEQQRFRFSNPELFSQTLRDAEIPGPKSGAQALLRAVRSSLAFNLPDGLDKASKWLHAERI